MHPVQRKAIFGMIDSIENQLRYVKSMLLMDDELVAKEDAARRDPPPRAPQGTEYLTDDEERKLEAEHEAARKAALAEHEEKTQKNWQALRQISEEETASTL